MGKALSVDLRVRVVEAIGSGMSRRAAATRFGISVATAIRCAASARGGERAPARQGGDMRSRTTERHAARIMAAYSRCCPSCSPKAHRRAMLPYAVGYESVPQFTREYWRMCGLPPVQETEAARRRAQEAA